MLVSTDEGILYRFDTTAVAAQAEPADDGPAMDDAERQAALDSANRSTQRADARWRTSNQRTTPIGSAAGLFVAARRSRAAWAAWPGI